MHVCDPNHEVAQMQQDKKTTASKSRY